MTQIQNLMEGDCHFYYYLCGGGDGGGRCYCRCQDSNSDPGSSLTSRHSHCNERRRDCIGADDVHVHFSSVPAAAPAAADAVALQLKPLLEWSLLWSKPKQGMIIILSKTTIRSRVTKRPIERDNAYLWLYLFFLFFFQ